MKIYIRNFLIVNLIVILFASSLVPNSLAKSTNRTNKKFAVSTSSRTNSVLTEESKEEKKLRERQKKEEERKEKEAKSKAKEQKKYNTVLEFALDEYASDSDFREDVDGRYIEMQEAHAKHAYTINTGTQVKTGNIDSESLNDDLKVERVLYNNPWVQDYVNRVGQEIVPEDSDKLYAFKVVSDPIPYAYTLSTGTILISTGMVALTDNEAQLAYVLAHEIAHVHKDHWRTSIMIELGEEEYNKRQEKKRRRLTALFGGLGVGVGAGIGAAAGGGDGAGLGGLIGLTVGAAIAVKKSRSINLKWEPIQENEADDFALRAVLKKSYDIQETPRLYAELRKVANSDARMGLGFLGDRKRIKERIEHADKLIKTDLQSQYQELVKSGKIIGSTPEFNLVMAELKRDTGIEALQYDMFSLAKKTLQQAVSLRSNDPIATYYYARVLKLVGRTKEDKEMSQTYLRQAIQLDTRQSLPEAQLHRALLLMEANDPNGQKEAIQALQSYILSYQKKEVSIVQSGGVLPPNTNLLYDYMRVLGENKWVAPNPDLYQQIKVVESGAPQSLATPVVKTGTTEVSPQASQPQPVKTTGTRKKSN